MCFISTVSFFIWYWNSLYKKFRVFMQAFSAICRKIPYRTCTVWYFHETHHFQKIPYWTYTVWYFFKWFLKIPYRTFIIPYCTCTVWYFSKPFFDNTIPYFKNTILYLYGMVFFKMIFDKIPHRTFRIPYRTCTVWYLSVWYLNAIP